MKNKYMTFVALAVAALATSCASDDLAEQKQNQSEPQTVTLTASVANNNTTRVGMTKDGTTAKFYWHNGDAISVLTVNGSSYGNAKFATDATTGETSATFTGEVTGTVGGYAVYPYSESHTFTSATALTYNLSAEYKSYKPESKIFGTTDDYPSNSTNMPMLGTIASGKISFKHLGGLAVIRIDKMPAASGTLTVTASEPLSGNFTVQNLPSGTPEITNTVVESSGNTVTFNFSGATQNGVGVFYLPLATGSYTNVTIVLKSGVVNQTIDYGSLTVERAKITAIPVVAHRVINGHEFVDLGLDVLWATMNVGANSNIADGTYYTESDASTWSGWGTSCRLPTKAEFEKLMNTDNCEWTWVSGYPGYYKITSKVTGYTGQTIFLPGVSYKFISTSSVPTPTIPVPQQEMEFYASGYGNNGYYWASDGNNTHLYFDNASSIQMTNDCPSETKWKYPIRAVATK